MEDSSVAYIRHCLKYNLTNDPGRRVATLLLRRLVAFYYYALVLNFPVAEKGNNKSYSYITLKLMKLRSRHSPLMDQVKFG
jgi:hypothetical protein